MKLAIWVMIALIVGGVAYFVSACPCERTPGLWLSGETVAEAVNDWSFVNDRDAVPLCQVEVRSWRPHSINLNCMSSAGRLYVSCSQCEGKSWSSMALANPEGNLRVGAALYPVTLRKVEAPAELDQAWAARAEKLGRQDTPRPAHWWSFEATSRPGG